jgi:hypothetical protein
MNQLKANKLINQLRSNETWNKVIDFITFHDPKSNKAKEINKGVSGYFGFLPIVIGLAIIIVTATAFSLILMAMQK